MQYTHDKRVCPCNIIQENTHVQKRIPLQYITSAEVYAEGAQWSMFAILLKFLLLKELSLVLHWGMLLVF